MLGCLITKIVRFARFFERCFTRCFARPLRGASSRSVIRNGHPRSGSEPHRATCEMPPVKLGDKSLDKI